MKKFKSLVLLLILALLLGYGIGCSSTDEPPQSTEYFLTAEVSEITLKVDDSYEVPYTTNVNSEAITWEVLDERIVDVNNGTITAKKRGQTVLSVYYADELYFEIIITVENKEVEVPKYTLNVIASDNNYNVQIAKNSTIKEALLEMYKGRIYDINLSLELVDYFLDSKYTVKCDINNEKIYRDTTIYAKYVASNNEGTYFKVDSVLTFNSSFNEELDFQIYSPVYGNQTEIEKIENYKLIKVIYKPQIGEYVISQIVSTNTSIPYNGFVIALTNEFYQKNINSFLVDNTISCNHYTINKTTKIYINKEKETFTSDFNYTSSLDAEYISAYDATNSISLYQKQGDEHAYPASVTKLITLLAAVKYGNLDDIHEVGDELDIMREGPTPSTAGLKEGQRWLLRHLLYAMMLPSGNDAAYSVATCVVKNMDQYKDVSTREAINIFATLMDEVAIEAGAKNSSFRVPDGNSYYNEDGTYEDRLLNHYVTANDLIAIGNYALKCGMICDVVGTHSIEFSIESGEKNIFTNTNALLNSSSGYYYVDAIGIKTGTTTPAGYCLLSAAYVDNRLIIIAVLKATTSPGRFSTTMNLYNAIFK